MQWWIGEGWRERKAESWSRRAEEMVARIWDDTGQGLPPVRMLMHGGFTGRKVVCGASTMALRHDPDATDAEAGISPCR
jgi:hypothetical protein